MLVSLGGGRTGLRSANDFTCASTFSPVKGAGERPLPRAVLRIDCRQSVALGKCPAGTEYSQVTP